MDSHSSEPWKGARVLAPNAVALSGLIDDVGYSRGSRPWLLTGAAPRLKISLNSGSVEYSPTRKRAFPGEAGTIYLFVQVSPTRKRAFPGDYG